MYESRDCVARESIVNFPPIILLEFRTGVVDLHMDSGVVDEGLGRGEKIVEETAHLVHQAIELPRSRPEFEYPES